MVAREVAHVAPGCFWGAERTFWELPGVYPTGVSCPVGVVVEPAATE